jgi:hypothetical protein
LRWGGEVLRLQGSAKRVGKERTVKRATTLTRGEEGAISLLNKEAATIEELRARLRLHVKASNQLILKLRRAGLSLGDIETLADISNVNVAVSRSGSEEGGHQVKLVHYIADDNITDEQRAPIGHDEYVVLLDSMDAEEFLEEGYHVAREADVWAASGLQFFPTDRQLIDCLS